MYEINLKLETIVVEVESRVVKSDVSVIYEKPYYDIHRDAARRLGTTRKKYRKMMNS